MNVELNYTEILNILNNFSNCTNLIASYQFDSEEIQAQFMSQIKNGPYSAEHANFYDASAEHFCHYIHNALGREICVNSDCSLMSKAKSTRKTVICNCSAGICETVTPIILDNVVIGYVMLGMFIDKENVYSKKEKVVEFAKKHNLDVDELCRLYDKLPVVSKEQLYGALNLLNLCISHFLDKQLIQLKSATLLEQITSYIKENLSSHITVNDICAKFFTNRQKLYKIFLEELNIPIKHYITNLRIEKAKRLLANSKKPIEAIAIETGFPDYNYFIRAFKKFAGVSPFKYRKTASGQE